MLKIVLTALFGLALFGSYLIAGESGPVMTKRTAKCTTLCPKEAEANAKAALALANVSKAKVTVPASSKGLCTCGSKCKCPDGVCPNCPDDKAGKLLNGLKIPGKSVDVPSLKPSVVSPNSVGSTYFQQNGFVYECNNGQCKIVGTCSPGLTPSSTGSR